MDWLYGDAPAKHKSPTKRLVQHKHAAFNHKKALRRKATPNSYSLTYVCNPHQTVMVQPRQGEIDYEMAEQQPAELYNKVMS